MGLLFWATLVVTPQPGLLFVPGLYFAHNYDNNCKYTLSVPQQLMNLCAAFESIPSDVINVIHNFSHVERGQLFFEIDVDFWTSKYAFFNDTFVIYDGSPANQLYVFCGKICRSLIHVENVEKIGIEHQRIFVYHSVDNQFSIFDLNGNCVSKIQLQIPVDNFSRWFQDSPAISGSEVTIPIHRIHKKHFATFQTYNTVSGEKICSFDVNDLVLNSCIDSMLDIYVIINGGVNVLLKMFDKHGNLLWNIRDTIQIIRPKTIIEICIFQGKLFIAGEESGHLCFFDEFGGVQWKIEKSVTVHDCLTSDCHLLIARYGTNKMNFQCFY